MNDNRENKLSRNYKVETFFDDHEAELIVGAPGLAAFVAQYKAKNVELAAHAGEGNEDITGSSTEKTYLKNVARDLALTVSGALYAHFLNIKKFKLAQKVYRTKSGMDSARDTDFYVDCKKLLGFAQDNSAAIDPLGAPAATLTAFSDSIDAFFAMIQDPQDERTEKSSALNMFDIAMKESEDILEIIKGIMLTQKADFPALHMQFLGACAIDDNVGGGTPSVPDFEFTVLPGAFYTAYTAPYNAARSFKAKNLSTQSLNWGLSMVEGSFSNPAVTLNPESTSTLQSATLGGSGDFLIFENTSLESIQVELTILDE